MNGNVPSWGHSGWPFDAELLLSLHRIKLMHRIKLNNIYQAQDPGLVCPLGMLGDDRPAVNGSRSWVIMWCSCCRHPFRAVSAAMMNPDAIVKDMANLFGARMMTGRKREKAIMRKTKPASRNAKKYANCCIFGICTLRVNLIVSMCLLGALNKN